MASKKRISPAERRHMDYLRRKGLKVGHLYESRLLKLRRKEVRRVLELCKEHGDITLWSDVIQSHLDESYLFDWYKGLYVDAGLPRARSTARDLSLGKASPEDAYWEAEIARYAGQQAGEKIVLVQGTLRDELINITRRLMTDDTQMPVELLARRISRQYEDIALWQCRRIAQTETMIGLAEAGNIAARSLDVGFTKQWVTSGLANTRDSHLAMDGVIVDMDDTFKLTDCEMMYPHDASLGAPAGEIINCACDVLRRPKPASYKTEVSGVSAGLTPRQVEINKYLSEIPSDKDDATKEAIAENIYELKQLLGIDKGEPMSYSKANNGNENPNFNQGGGYRVNCQTCTITHWLRRLGFDVQAKPNINGSAFKVVNWQTRFLNPDGSVVDYDYTNFWKAMKGYKTMNEARLKEYITEKLSANGVYEVYCQWKSGSAHVFMAEVKSGKIRFFDPQTGESDVSEYIKHMKPNNVGIARIDDKILNPKIAELVLKS